MVDLENLKDEINQRNANLRSDWWPFVQNMDDIMDQMKLIKEELDDLNNKIGETTGMVKNLRKILIKLEVIDDRFIF
jgi:uncharacterized coiled-coil DUF342 family protein|tara:strand:- start:218 stop:448 length:231 start_codon:yes stop_codon:yes gene_type:complete